MKYQGIRGSTAAAEYSEEKGSPFWEALPEFLGKEDFFRKIGSSLPAIYDLEKKSPQDRRSYLSELTRWFKPLDYMYVLYDMLYRAMASTYQTKTIVDSVRQLNALYTDFRTGRERELPYSTQAYSGAVLGLPGIGKTSTIQRCLSTMPQVIVHTKYQGKEFYTKQINYLMVECPSDCSVKTLAFNIFSAIDKAIGSDYFTQIARSRSLAASAITTKLKIICLNHHIGLIVIDEIQNAVLTAARNKQTKPLIKFLVELTNETATSICFCGTLEAEEVFTSQEHLKRRTRGLRLLPMKYDVTYRKFITEIWEYQTTLQKAPLTEKLMKQIFDLSGGIPAYIVKIIQEAQVQAILSGTEKLSYEMIKQAVTVLGIEVPKIYSRGGTSISDFSVQEVKLEEIGMEIEPASALAAEIEMQETNIIQLSPVRESTEEPEIKKDPEPEQDLESEPEQESAKANQKLNAGLFMEAMAADADTGPVKRFYSSKRGRPEKERDASDLLMIWKKDGTRKGLLKSLGDYHMLERRCY